MVSYIGIRWTSGIKLTAPDVPVLCWVRTFQSGTDSRDLSDFLTAVMYIVHVTMHTTVGDCSVYVQVRIPLDLNERSQLSPDNAANLKFGIFFKVCTMTFKKKSTKLLV